MKCWLLWVQKLPFHFRKLFRGKMKHLCILQPHKARVFSDEDDSPLVPPLHHRGLARRSARSLDRCRCRCIFQHTAQNLRFKPAPGGTGGSRHFEERLTSL